MAASKFHPRLSLLALGIAAGTTMSSVSSAGLRQLNDADLAGISGQAGITVEMDTNLSVDKIMYFDDSRSIYLQDVRLASNRSAEEATFLKVDADIPDDGSLNLDVLIDDHRFNIGDVKLGGDPSIGMGNFFTESVTELWQFDIGSGNGGFGYTFGVQFDMSEGRFGYSTNGNLLLMDDIEMTLSAPDILFQSVGSALSIRAPSITGRVQIGDIRYSNDGWLYGDASYLPSYGAMAIDFDLKSFVFVRAGGREGQGLRMDGRLDINRLDILYADGNYGVAIRDISGFVSVFDMRMDVTQDWQGRDALGITFGSILANLSIGSIELGAPVDESTLTASAGPSLGSLNLNFLFESRTYNGETFGNAIYLQGGGDLNSGNQGIRLATEWSLASGTVNWTNDGNSLFLDGLQSWGRGDLTIDITREGVFGGQQYYDGIRLGFEDLYVGYRINGYRIGSEDAELQSGSELLLGLGVYPSYEFRLNGHVTVGAGGAEGTGLTINSDIYLDQGKFAVLADAYEDADGNEIEQKGVWATELSYEMHLRDTTVDVTNEGLAIVAGEAWSTMDIGNLRVGSDSGKSFGRFKLERFEQGSSMTISGGAAEDACVGGSGSSASTCTGVWQERGDQGLLISMRNIFSEASAATNRRNALTWETGRAVDGSGKAINDSGNQLVINNFYTNDGQTDAAGQETNTYGMQTDMAIDVVRTRVVKKTTTDAGVAGSELIRDPGTALGYRWVVDPSEGQKQNRPLGLNVDTRVRFKELAVEGVDLVHPDGGSSRMIYGAKLQNADIRANLTATPIRD